MWYGLFALVFHGPMGALRARTVPPHMGARAMPVTNRAKCWHEKRQAVKA